jgi:surfeit locus 1 family protein
VTDWSTLRFRPVTLTGRYDVAHQVLIDNRIDAGRVGFHVVTPLVLDDGRAVLVNRGFVAARPTRAELPVVPAPAGELTVRGRIDLPGRYLELAGSKPPPGNVWQNLDPARFAAATGVAVLPIVVLQDARDAPGDGLARNWPAPDAGVDMHRSYMLQWLAFAALTLGLWVWHQGWRR